MSYRELILQLQKDVTDIKKRINKIEIRMAFIFGILFAISKLV